MDPLPTWTTLVRRSAYRNPWFAVREDLVRRPDGAPGIYGVVEVPDSVFVVAHTEQDRIWLVRQWRYPTGRWVWELPAGGCDGLPPVVAGQRELAEEVGLAAARWTALGVLRPTCAGLSRDGVHLLLAEDLTPADPARQPDEVIAAARSVPVDEVLDMVAAGELTDVQSCAALLRFELHRRGVAPSAPEGADRA